MCFSPVYDAVRLSASIAVAIRNVAKWRKLSTEPSAEKDCFRVSLPSSYISVCKWRTSEQTRHQNCANSRGDAMQAHESGCVVETESTRQAATSLHAAHQSVTANVVTPAETPSAPLAGGLSCFSDDCNLMLPKTRPGSSDEIHTGGSGKKHGAVQQLKLCFGRGLGCLMIGALLCLMHDALSALSLPCVYACHRI